MFPDRINPPSSLSTPIITKIKNAWLIHRYVSVSSSVIGCTADVDR